MGGRATLVAYLAAFMLGSALWGAVAVFGDRAEPWDAGLFWRAGYPTALVLSGLLGLAFPDRPWRWAVCVFVSLLLVMIADGADFGLLPMGLLLAAVLSLPALGAAVLAARLRR